MMPPTMTNPMTTMPPSISRELVSRAAWKAGFVGAINALAVCVGVRLVLLLAVAGAVFLTFLAVEQGQADLFHLLPLAIYCFAVVVPLVWLAERS